MATAPIAIDDDVILVRREFRLRYDRKHRVVMVDLQHPNGPLEQNVATWNALSGLVFNQGSDQQALYPRELLDLAVACSVFGNRKQQ